MSISYSNVLYTLHFLLIRNKPNMTKWVINLIITHDYIRNKLFWQCSGSAVDWLTRYQNVADSSPMGGTVLFP